MSPPTAFLPCLPLRSPPSSLKSLISPSCTVQPPPDPRRQPQPVAAPQPLNPLANVLTTLRTRNHSLAAYGIAAFIAYGLFDAITYTASFLLSLRAYLAAGKALTWRTLPQVLALMWGINNLSRPFRVGGALALAPFVDTRIVRPVRAFLAKSKSNTQD